MRAVLLSAALLLIAGGGALVALGVRSRQRAITRLRALIDAPAQKARPDVSAAAAVWARLVRAADQAGRGSTLFERLGARLAAAGWPLRPGEFCLFTLGGSAGAALFGFAVTGRVLVGALAGVSALLVAWWVLERQARRMSARAEAQLPAVLSQLAASLRTGASLSQAIAVVAEHAGAPLGPQFARTLAETSMGRSLDDALAAMADRVGATDLRWSVRAMSIQARTGGKLSDVLEVLAEFMRDREEVRREVAALTADGRFSALILTLLPFVVTGALLVVRPAYLTPMFQRSLGLVMIAGASVLMLGAYLWIRRIVRVEV